MRHLWEVTLEFMRFMDVISLDIGEYTEVNILIAYLHYGIKLSG
jgi:hypothetical protein